MDTFWLKAALVIVVLIVCVGAVVVWTSKGIEEARNPETTFEDMVQRDKNALLAEPNAKDLAGQTPQPTTSVTQPEQPSEPVTEQPKAEPVKFYFTELSEIDKIEAERLIAMIPSGRSLGRLPMTGFNLMVETCRQIMGNWPGSIYDYQARRALNDMPERFRDRYNIKPEELDLMFFTKQRPNTIPHTIEQEEY